MPPSDPHPDAAPRRVLFIAPQPFFQWRGSPIRVSFDVQALAELGYEVDLLTFPFGEDKRIPGVRIHRVPNFLGLKNIRIGPSLWKALYDIPLLFMALRLAARNRYAVVHSVEEAGALGVLVAGFCNARLIFEKHSDSASYKQGWLRTAVMRVYEMVEAFTVRHADAVIATGTGLVAQVKQMEKDVPTHHIFDIPSSLIEAEPARAAALRAELRKNADDVLVMYVGSFEAYQGMDLMFESIPLARRMDARVRFIIIGGTPDQIAERTAWLAARGAADAVTFLGKVPPDQLPSYLTASDILLSPRAAGVNTPLKMLDYLKAGRAIVATDNEANRRIVSAQNALLVAPEPGAFAGGIARLVADPELRQRLGQSGRGLIRERYNFTVFKERLRCCYDEALNQTPDTQVKTLASALVGMDLADLSLLNILEPFFIL